MHRWPFYCRVAHGGVINPSHAAWYDDEDSSYLKYRTGESGTYVIGVSTHPNMITMSPEDFIAYLKHDGVLDTAHDASGGHLNSYDLRTDNDGRARFLLSNKALWYISLIHMRKINDAEADYESNWATITFQVK